MCTYTFVCVLFVYLRTKHTYILYYIICKYNNMIIIRARECEHHENKKKKKNTPVNMRVCVSAGARFF